MYKTILLAYDGSLEGALALREGTLLAKLCGAQVVLLAVVPNTTGGAEMAGGVVGALSEQMAEYKDLLKRAVEWLKGRGMEPIPKLFVGDPAKVIGAVATEIEADLVVVGLQRKSFLSRWWSGSTQAYISDHVGCSILVARNTISDEVIEAALPKRPVD